MTIHDSSNKIRAVLLSNNIYIHNCLVNIALYMQKEVSVHYHISFIHRPSSLAMWWLAALFCVLIERETSYAACAPSTLPSSSRQ